ncbi:hypothetical protein A306_00006537, partial [Columba livia]
PGAAAPPLWCWTARGSTRAGRARPTRGAGWWWQGGCLPTRGPRPGCSNPSCRSASSAGTTRRLWPSTPPTSSRDPTAASSARCCGATPAPSAVPAATMPTPSSTVPSPKCRRPDSSNTPGPPWGRRAVKRQGRP